VYGSNGQVVLGNWYEYGMDEGIEMFVAKNSTTFYSLWWFFPRVSDVDYALKVEDYQGAHWNYKDTSVSFTKAVTDSTANLCYILPDSSVESSCVSASSSSSSNDDDDDEEAVENMTITAAAFSIATFVVLVGYIIYSCAMASSAKGPMSSTEGGAGTSNL
jgi:hypothetical protein